MVKFYRGGVSAFVQTIDFFFFPPFFLFYLGNTWLINICLTLLQLYKRMFFFFFLIANSIFFLIGGMCTMSYTMVGNPGQQNLPLKTKVKGGSFQLGKDGSFQMSRVNCLYASVSTAPKNEHDL